MQKQAIYAGTFDPLTLGHLDLVERGAEIFDELILAVSRKSVKGSAMFPLKERLDLCKRATKHLANVVVVPFDGLLVEFARKMKITLLLRGLRAYSDFEYEFQMALTNRKLAPEIETLFMMPKEIHSYVSSSTVREVARLGGDTMEFVPPAVHKAIREKMKNENRRR